MEAIEHKFQPRKVLFRGFRVDHDFVQVDQADLHVHAGHDDIHKPLEGRSSVAQAERHGFKTVHAPRADESRLV